MDVRPVITMLTDFGISDTFVAQMKGVMLGICPEAAIVDITHEVPPQDVRAGAILLASAAPTFPPATIHMAVVDPEVGTNRKILCAIAGRHIFLAPDNGILTLVLRENPIGWIFEVKNSYYFRKFVSSTFQGRDVFAPVAAHLATGISPAKLGPQVDEIVRLGIPTAKLKSDGTVVGEVILIDHFGNALTNIPQKSLRKIPGEREVYVKNKNIGRIVDAFAERPEGRPLAVFGGSGRLEIAVCNGNAAEMFGLKRGDKIMLRTV